MSKTGKEEQHVTMPCFQECCLAGWRAHIARHTSVAAGLLSITHTRLMHLKFKLMHIEKI